MSVKAKYQEVLNLGEQLEIKDGSISDEDRILKIKGVANTPYEKDLLWDKIKELGGSKPFRYKSQYFRGRGFSLS